MTRIKRDLRFINRFTFFGGKNKERIKTYITRLAVSRNYRREFLRPCVSRALRMLTLAQFLTLEPLISSRDRINPEENAIETSLALPSIAVTAFELSSRSFVGGTEETTSSSIVVFERLASKKGKKVIMERGKDGARPRKRRERKRDSRESPSSLPLFRVTRRKEL